MGGVHGGRYLRKLADRSLNQLGEEGHKQREFKEILFGLGHAPVYIHYIAGGLEHEEGNAHRQTQGQKRQEGAFGHSLKGCDQNDFANCQQRKVEHKGKNHKDPVTLLYFCFVCLSLITGHGLLVCGKVGILLVQPQSDEVGCQVGGDCGKQNENQAFDTGKCVKSIAGSQQKDPLRLLRYQIIDNKQHSQTSQKAEGCELHSSLSVKISLPSNAPQGRTVPWRS